MDKHNSGHNIREAWWAALAFYMAVRFTANGKETSPSTRCGRRQCFRNANTSLHGVQERWLLRDMQSTCTAGCGVRSQAPILDQREPLQLRVDATGPSHRIRLCEG